MLTGQETLLRLSLRCSIKACIIRISLIIVTPIIISIGDVKLGGLAHLGEFSVVSEKLFLYPDLVPLAALL
jgi:hypothetical protein